MGNLLLLHGQQNTTTRYENVPGEVSVFLLLHLLQIYYCAGRYTTMTQKETSLN
jgi:hypothetical protein